MSKSYSPSPAFVHSYDLLRWLIPCTLNFPKSQRGVLARQLQTQAFALYETLVDAAKSDTPYPLLRRADGHLAKLRAYLRLARELNLLSPTQYAHVTGLQVDMGRVLGGWLQKAAQPQPDPDSQ